MLSLGRRLRFTLGFAVDLTVGSDAGRPGPSLGDPTVGPLRQLGL